jgi:N-acetyl-anhydromuramyl-L-alanine amidase AmpD
MSDGEIYVGYRWMDQLPGAHAGGKNGDNLNLHTISICLVGDGNRRSFSRLQYERLVQLTGALCRELNIPANHVYLHSDVAPTTDPGALFPTADFRREIAKAR